MDTFATLATALADSRTAAFIALSYASVTVAMATDFISGLRKARRAGLATTSRGLKMTCDKARKYFLPMVCLLPVDLLTATLLPLPLFTMAMSLFNIACEWKSVMENTRTKAELREAAHTVNVVIRNHDDIAQLLGQLIEAASQAHATEPPRKPPPRREPKAKTTATGRKPKSFR